ncbi:MAG: LemA family protein, partial [Coprobacillaceae bacterium]
YQYTNKNESFHSVIIANMFGFKPMPLFETSPQDQEVPQVKF